MTTRMCSRRNIKGGILLADKHSILRPRLAKLITQERDFGVGAEVGSVVEAIEVLRFFQPDPAIVDLRVPGVD